jgi:hemolysin activation/secretion protein
MQARKSADQCAHLFIAAALIGGTLSFTATLAHAQASANTERDAAEQNRARERETRLREQQERSPDVRLPGVELGAMAKLPTGETPCFEIRRISLEGEQSTPFQWALEAVDGPDHADPALGHCLGALGINAVMTRVQNAIIARGWATARVLAPPQDLALGSLHLSLLPGRIHAIRLAEPIDPRATLWNALPMKAGDLLNLRDIEQALENLKRAPSAEADIQIEPAAEPGQSDLVVRYKQAFPFRLSVSADDSGSKGTGKYQGSATVSYDNWWTLNDLFYVMVNQDMGGGQFGPRGTRGDVLHYSLPWGYWTLGSTVSHNRYYQSVAGASQDYNYSGTSENREVKLARLIHRDATRKTTVALRAWQRASNNYIDDTEVLVQRRITGGWELSGNHRATLGPATLEANLAYRRGTGAFGALAAPEEAFGDGTSRFKLITADATLNAPFKLGSQTLQYNGVWRIQANRTPLTPQDRFAIGGRFSVRGFDGESSLSAERGWLLRNDIGWQFDSAGTQAYLGIDHGGVGGPSADLLLGKHLAGAVIGLRGRVKDLNYDLFAGGPLSRPAGFKTASVTAGFNFNWSF